VGYWRCVGAWRSLVARTVRVGEVLGSNPSAPIALENREHERIQAKGREDPGVPWDAIRSRSRLFVGLETANGPQGEQKRTAKGPQPPASGYERQSRLWARVPRLSWCAGRDAWIQGGPEALGEVLAEWYGVEDGQLCDGRKAIIDVMSRILAGRLRGRIEEKGAEHSFNDRRFPNAADIL
jgi:hypothetical protein